MSERKRVTVNDPDTLVRVHCKGTGTTYEGPLGSILGKLDLQYDGEVRIKLLVDDPVADIESQLAEVRRALDAMTSERNLLRSELTAAQHKFQSALTVLGEYGFAAGLAIAVAVAFFIAAVLG